MFVQNFIELRAAAHALQCSQSFYDAETILPSLLRALAISQWLNRSVD